MSSKFTAAGFAFMAACVCLPAHAEEDEQSLKVSSEDYYSQDGLESPRVRLGQLLFFDKILSGNRNISCATCHHPFAATADGLALPVGEGGRGLSVTRNTGDGEDAIEERVPRNAPALFNLGARQFSTMFHDGRVAVDDKQKSGFLNPQGSNLPSGLNNVLAVQAMFPVTSAVEMAGAPGENEIADAAASGDISGSSGVWALIAERLQTVPEYVRLFQDAFEDVLSSEHITMVHAANAIAAFETFAFRSVGSAFDRYMRGDTEAMTAESRFGMTLFYGDAGCSDCHSGPFQTDHSFHSIVMPQIGPGKGDGVDGLEDFGRERVTGDPADRYRFRTPSLRNVALTGPWGHSGAYGTLAEVVSHHLSPRQSLTRYAPDKPLVPYRDDLARDDFAVINDENVMAALRSENDLVPAKLNAGEFAAVMAFLHALTDHDVLDLRWCIPASVPSGLAVWD